MKHYAGRQRGEGVTGGDGRGTNQPATGHYAFSEGSTQIGGEGFQARRKKYADGGDPLAGMSPVDALRLRSELAAKPRALTADEQWKNYGKTGAAIASILPVIGNAMSAYDAWQSGKGTVQAAAAGDVKGTALNAAATGLSALGAVTGLPLSKASRRRSMRLENTTNLPMDKNRYNVMRGGKKVAYLNGKPLELSGKPDTFYVDYITAPGGAQSIGPQDVRDIARLIKAKHPEVTKLTGNRISGARAKDAEGLVSVPVTVPIDRITRRAETVPWVDRYLPTWGYAGQVAKDASSTARIFAGPSAKTANKAALAEAEEMRAVGIAPEIIHRQTGWFWGHDGKPRFEIDDSKATFNMEALGPDARPLGEVLHHPELYEAYPDLAKIRTMSGGNAELGPGVMGDYTEGFRSKYFPESSIPGRIRIRPGRPVDSMLPTALHEAQHDIQAVEGFAKGSNTRSAYDPRPKAEREAIRERLERESALAYAEDFNARRAGDFERANKAWEIGRNLAWQAEQMNQRGRGAYFREAGEVEARNVEMRREMNMDDRRLSYPPTTQDIIPEAIWYKPDDYANGGRAARLAAYANGGRVTVGAVEGDTGGREDALDVQVPEGAYVIPADVVAALGEGNTPAGMRRLEQQFGKVRAARGGAVVPIQISDGEFVVPPEAVEMVGGPDILDQFVLQARAQFIDHLSKLEGPNQ